MALQLQKLPESTQEVQMEEIAEIVLHNARTLLDKVKVYEIKLSASTAQVKPKQAVEMGLEVLKLLEIGFPEQPSSSDIQQGLEQTASLFAGKNIADFINLPCQGCNNHKYNKTDGRDLVSGEIARLYHPRQEQWNEHFTWNYI